jgi:predicted dehydrogenase
VLRIGIIGYGGRIAHMARALKPFGIPYAITAVADPRGDLIRANDDGLLANTRFHPTADDLLAQAAHLDGVMIGTRLQSRRHRLAALFGKTGGDYL